MADKKNQEQVASVYDGDKSYTLRCTHKTVKENNIKSAI